MFKRSRIHTTFNLANKNLLGLARRMFGLSHKSKGPIHDTQGTIFTLPPKIMIMTKEGGLEIEKSGKETALTALKITAQVLAHNKRLTATAALMSAVMAAASASGNAAENNLLNSIKEAATTTAPISKQVDAVRKAASNIIQNIDYAVFGDDPEQPSYDDLDLPSFEQDSPSFEQTFSPYQTYSQFENQDKIDKEIAQESNTIGDLISNFQPTVSNAFKERLKESEGLRLEAYLDPVGVWTIGYGHTGEVDGKPITRGMTITQEKADELLEIDILVAEEQVREVLGSKLVTVGQWESLIDFTFNKGIDNLKDSTLLKHLKEDRDLEAAQEFNRWVYARDRDPSTGEFLLDENGKHIYVKLEGLVTRAKENVETYLSSFPNELIAYLDGKSANAKKYQVAFDEFTTVLQKELNKLEKAQVGSKQWDRSASGSKAILDQITSVLERAKEYSNENTATLNNIISDAIHTFSDLPKYNDASLSDDLQEKVSLAQYSVKEVEILQNLKDLADNELKALSLQKEAFSNLIKTVEDYAHGKIDHQQVVYTQNLLVNTQKADFSLDILPKSLLANFEEIIDDSAQQQFAMNVRHTF